MTAIAHQVAVFFLHHVTDVDADPELDAAVLWQAGIALDHAVLDLDRAANSVHDAAEFDDRSIARALDDTTVMYGNCGIDQIATQSSQPRENSVLVGPGKAAVTDHIGNKDRGKLARFRHHTLPPGAPKGYHEPVEKPCQEKGMGGSEGGSPRLLGSFPR